MNRYDSSTLSEYLISRGHRWVDNLDDADLIVVNTCAVRQHAENRAIGRLKSIVARKKKNHNLKIGIMGCIAQQNGEKLFEIIPQLDFVVGTDQLPVIAQIAEGKFRCGTFVNANTDFMGIDSIPSITPGQVSTFITIMRGCDNFCSYCVVPYVRGRERSLPDEKILDEIARVVDNGIKEITLLGQNVNSYRYENVDFPALLEKVAQIPGVERIRFVTNHPKDFSDKILDVLEKYPRKIPPAFHLPLQSGSADILSAMNRKYSPDEYIALIENIYRRFPHSAISTDIIVGFPGESEQDFQATLNMMKAVNFSGVFAFRYSIRPGTAAEKLHHDVPEELKIQRLNQVIRLGIQLANNFSENLVGTIQDVLVERVSYKNPGKLRCTAPSGRTVLIDENSAEIGQIVPVKITAAKTWVLWGKIIS